MSMAPFRVHNARDLGAAVRYFRAEAHLSQALLAEQAGVHRTYLSDLEQGQATAALDRLVRILSELGVRITIGPAEW